MTSKQRQEGGDNSTNIQAGAVVVYNGPSLTEVRAMALDVFNENFCRLAGEAAATARDRAEEITEKFLAELQNQNPQGLTQAQDPDFQYGLYTVQREYARNGDADLGDLLVDLLVDRTKHEERSILQIVLNESLAVAPKLTADQLSILSVVFVLKYTRNLGLAMPAALTAYLEQYLGPFLTSLTNRMAAYQHLEFAGCGTVGIGSISIPSIFRKSYPGLFSKGFTGETLGELLPSLPADLLLLTQCHRDPEKLQLNSAFDEDAFRKVAAELAVTEEDATTLWRLGAENLMSEDEVRELLVSLWPSMAQFIALWDESPMKNLTLTSVGIAIGHANIKRRCGEFTNLSIWIN